MRIKLMTAVVFMASISYGQEDTKFKIQAYHFSFGKESLYGISQNLGTFLTQTDNADFIQHTDDFGQSSKPRIGRGNMLQFDMEWGKDDSYFTIITGLSFNRKVVGYYSLGNYNVTSGDTVYVANSSSIDTLVADTITYESVNYNSTLSELRISAEFLWSLKAGGFKLSSGIGIGAGVGVDNDMSSSYQKELGIEYRDQYYEAKYFSNLLHYEYLFNNQVDDPFNYQYANSDYIMGGVGFEPNVVRERGKTLGVGKLFIPIRLSYDFDKGWLNRLGVFATGAVGNDLQFARGTPVKGRFYYNWRVGLTIRK